MTTKKKEDEVKDHLPKYLFKRTASGVENQVVKTMEALAAAIRDGWVESPDDCEPVASSTSASGDGADAAALARIDELEEALSVATTKVTSLSEELEASDRARSELIKQVTKLQKQLDK
jgi:hypothetical protein